MREHNITISFYILHQSLDRGRLHALEDISDFFILLFLRLHVYGDGDDGIRALRAVVALWTGRHSAGTAAWDRRVFRDGVLVAEVPSINDVRTEKGRRGVADKYNLLIG